MRRAALLLMKMRCELEEYLNYFRFWYLLLMCGQQGCVPDYSFTSVRASMSRNYLQEQKVI